MTASHFSKEFCANPKNRSTNKKRGPALCCLHKSFVNSKAFFDVKRLRTYYFKIKLKEESKKKYTEWLANSM
jgi:hypothetical protein